ncbi:hypothetical protein MIND_01014700 [Mycena indigotica]|uniref:Gaa1-domain-containing protein n=1 Tax=Mycena indigotica TaxID=2126181 RepID=A0A8H6S8B2_9AGAR|nr:uncharacterized protein MIND_01014700 [Mycena indigotica]KAF7294771.1 hypothetical protein MIND_01014700 [Mycena indigotica]
MDRIRTRLRAIFRPEGDQSLLRLQRRRKLVSALTQRVDLIKWSFFLVGYLWMLALPSQQLGRGIYIDENALQPGQVNTYWNWGDVAAADRYLEQLEGLRDANASSHLRASTLAAEFMKLGIPASTQNYRFSSSVGTVEGTNAYAIISSPRTSGTEAMVISASWVSRIDEANGALNLRGVSTVLALAGFLKKYSLWAKDIVFVVSDGHMDGMQAWLNAYHGRTQSNLEADELELTSGVIWTALNIDYPGHSFSHLGIFHEGINGRLPNQDLLNSLTWIARWTVPVIIYDHLETPRLQIPSWMPNSLRDEIRTYDYRSRNVLRHVKHQARGRGSGVHGLFHQFRIDAFTMFALPATGPHGFHALGHIIESTLRTTNNLLERLHASIFFYILTASEHFLKIGSYLPSAIMISVAMMFSGLKVWSDSAWVMSSDEKGSTWIQRRRPVLPVLVIMFSTHILGCSVFALTKTSWFINNLKTSSAIILALCGTLPLSALFVPKQNPHTVAPMSQLLKALNLCFASTVISITTVVNFSLAATLAILLGIPLTVSLSSSLLPLRLGQYGAYLSLALGWLSAQEEIRSALWDWQILGVWFAPFVCIVYTPLVLQAAIACLLPV